MAGDISDYHALILAAGFSERMGDFKPLLPLGDTTVLGRLLGVYRRAGLTGITVVNGHRGDEVRAAAEREGAASAHNPHPEDGMFSSVRVGVASLPAHVRRVFIHPVDIPLVRTDTIALLLRAAAESDAPILMPHYDGEPGHPPLIDARVFPGILASDGEGGLRAVLDGWRGLPVPVADREILFDLDRKDDYHEALRRLAARAGLTAGEAEQLLRLYFRVPEHLYAHSAAVARAAEAMVAALTAAGVAMDHDLAVAGAWLHDVGKGRPRHAAAGAGMLRELGFPALADVILPHNHGEWPEDAPFDESAVVALADKLAEGDRVVTIERRFATKREMFADDPEAVAAVDRRLRGARRLAERFAELSGRTVDDMVNRIAQGESEER